MSYEQYRLYRITLEGNETVKVHITDVDSMSGARLAANADYGMDVGEGLWFPHGYVINCGPEYRGDGKTVTYLIATEEQS